MKEVSGKKIGKKVVKVGKNKIDLTLKGGID